MEIKTSYMRRAGKLRDKSPDTWKAMRKASKRIRKDIRYAHIERQDAQELVLQAFGDIDGKPWRTYRASAVKALGRLANFALGNYRKDYNPLTGKLPPSQIIAKATANRKLTQANNPQGMKIEGAIVTNRHLYLAREIPEEDFDLDNTKYIDPRRTRTLLK